MKVVLVGQPNVGKSAILHRLTGAEVIVSNYAGTSVELTRGNVRLGKKNIEIIDTPGIYSSLAAVSAEETITKELLSKESVNLVINVVDATSLARNLALTLELLGTAKPLLVLLNQMDRVRSKGMVIRHAELARWLGVTVIPFSAVTGEGVAEVFDYLDRGLSEGFALPNPEVHKGNLQVLAEEGGFSCDGLCWACSHEKAKVSCHEEQIWGLQLQARALANKVLDYESRRRVQWLSRLEQLVDRPVLGALVLMLVLWVGFKLLLAFTGWTEGIIEGLFQPVQQFLAFCITKVLPDGFVSQVLSKGIAEGLLIPFALVLPAIFMVSIFMAVLEDTGLLARYAVVLDRLGRILGISGQAVIPLALGFGCRTPAVVATRILSNPRERLVVITLLSIVIPCAATLGMIVAVINAFNAYPEAIAGSMLMAFIGLGLGLKKRFGVKQEEMVYELPPLRVPFVKTLVAKVRIRFRGFFTEVLPLLVIMSIGVRVLIDSGVLRFVVGIERVTEFLFGVPAEAFVAVLITVIQRYLAPLVLLNLDLDPRQATIAISMIALSLPCLPVMVTSWREVGAWNLGKIIATGLAISFTTGTVLNLVLPK
ncbi:ferrous iron transporter B [Syntrophothermus lipocalidus]|uniref:Small GTP-binding protein n=1 Tax=Syntrophothermus lipocalidus (strain DSM 12680 / TGB-C1) TaxID=643648 RepID=D7CNN5_SYNLT|nr:ferrous iron transporter B [Syntrophothermus lipocalidus]ADI02320.1 small GTP-binding protein [Syntrophothermus lipocalidus DSM 12680]